MSQTDVLEALADDYSSSNYDLDFVPKLVSPHDKEKFIVEWWQS